MLEALGACVIAIAIQEGSRTVRESWPDSAPRVEREVVRDERGVEISHGTYRSWHDNGQLESQGLYAKGLRTGEWQTWHRNGRMSSKGSYVDDHHDGRWLFWDENGAKRPDLSGMYRLERHDYAPGRISHVGEVRDDRRQGPWTYFWKDGSPQFAGEYRDGLRQGEWVFWRVDGKPSRLLLSGNYEDGKRAAPLSVQRLAELLGASAPVAKPVPSPAATSRALDERGMAELAFEPSEWSSYASDLAELDLANPRDVALAKALCVALSRRARWHNFGWPPELTNRPENDLVEVIEAWASLLAMVEDEPLFWELDTRSFCVVDKDGRHEGSCLVQCSPPLRRDERSEVQEKGLRLPLYAKRFPTEKGSPARAPRVKHAIEEALLWLVAHQSIDGRWGCEGFPENCGTGSPCSGQGSPAFDVGVTGLALLALLGDGNTLLHGPHANAVMRGIGWLLDIQREKGSYCPLIGIHFLYDHAIATLAMSEAYTFSPHPALRESLERAVEFLCAAQNPSLGWRYMVPADGDNDTSVTSWALSALHAARVAGIAVDPRALSGGLTWIDSMTNLVTGRCGYTDMGGFSSRMPELVNIFPGEKTEAMTAAALFCRCILGQTSTTTPVIKKHVELLKLSPPAWKPENGTIDFYYWYYGAQALHLAGDKSAWRRTLEHALVDSQSKAGYEKGSWDPVDAWGKAGGRVYSTALLALCLEATDRLTPVDRH